MKIFDYIVFSSVLFFVTVTICFGQTISKISETQFNITTNKVSTRTYALDDLIAQDNYYTAQNISSWMRMKAIEDQINQVRKLGIITLKEAKDQTNQTNAQINP